MWNIGYMQVYFFIYELNFDIVYIYYELSTFLSTVQIFYPWRAPPHSCTLWMDGFRGQRVREDLPRRFVLGYVCYGLEKLCLKNGFNIQGLTPKL